MLSNRALLGFVTAVALGSCGKPADDARNDVSAEENVGVEATPLPVKVATLDRAQLLLATARAASAAALGQDDSEAQRKLRGALFDTRIRFGCPSDNMQVSGGPFSLRFEEQTRTLRIRAQPDLDQSDPMIAQIGGETVEAVEGFRMYRPWLLDAACPPAPPKADVEAGLAEPGAQISAPRLHWVGIAQFFTESDSRTRRRDHRAYEATKILPEGMEPSRSGYDLVLSGRLRPLPGGKVITCIGNIADQPPNCIVSVEFDRVRIERADNREPLAEWAAS